MRKFLLFAAVFFFPASPLGEARLDLSLDPLPIPAKAIVRWVDAKDRAPDVIVLDDLTSGFLWPVAEPEVLPEEILPSVLRTATLPAPVVVPRSPATWDEAVVGVTSYRPVVHPVHPREVPEPTTWIMLIFGFALIGLILRSEIRV